MGQDQIADERFEDVMYDVISLFCEKPTCKFVKFATSSNGLNLKNCDMSAICKDNKDDVQFMMREAILKWKQMNWDTDSNSSNRLPKRLKKLRETWELGNYVRECQKWWFIGFVLVAVLAWIFCSVYPHYLKFGTVEDKCQIKEQGVINLLKKMNNETWESVSDHAFKDLEKPEYDIFPDTVLVDFYQNFIESEQYTPEHQFTQQSSKISGDFIKMSEFFNETVHGPARYVALVGGVGYGKTEMLKRFAEDVFRKRMLNEVEYVKFISLYNLHSNEMMTAANLLFGEITGFDQDVVECALNFVNGNQSKFLLILDGIDQFETELDDKNHTSNITEKVKTSELLASLCSGHLFGDMKVLISSREHAIRHYTDKMRPDKVIALSGFSQAAIENLVHKFFGIQHQTVWERLNDTTLLSLSSVPMFFFFTVTVLDSGKAAPTTSTQVLMNVLHHHVTSGHVDCNIISLISKLKPMAFAGMKKGDITFTKEHLPDGVSFSDVKDLLVTSPGVNFQNKRLLDGHFKLHFCHQSILEALASLYVAEMPIDEFQMFIDEKIHIPKWAIVRRMLCGILLNPDTYNVARGNDPTVGLLNTKTLNGDKLKEKQHILRESLRQQLITLQGDGRKKAALLELMHSLHEAGHEIRDVVSSSVEEINLLNLPLTKSDVHVLLNVIEYSKHLTFLSLASCRLDADDIFKLSETLKDHDVTVRILLLGSYEKDLGKRDAEAIKGLLQYIEDALWLAYRINTEDQNEMKKIMKVVGRPEKIYSWSTNGNMIIMDNNH